MGVDWVWRKQWITIYIPDFSLCPLVSVDAFSTKCRTNDRWWDVCHAVFTAFTGWCWRPVTLIRSWVKPRTHEIGVRPCPCSRFITLTHESLTWECQENLSHTLWVLWRSTADGDITSRRKVQRKHNSLRRPTPYSVYNKRKVECVHSCNQTEHNNNNKNVFLT